jgi:hypothetical protein
MTMDEVNNYSSITLASSPAKVLEKKNHIKPTVIIS